MNKKNAKLVRNISSLKNEIPISVALNKESCTAVDLHVFGEATISNRNYGKSCYLDKTLFLPPPPLNNVEKQSAKLASSYVMDL